MKTKYLHINLPDHSYDRRYIQMGFRQVSKIYESGSQIYSESIVSATVAGLW